MRLIMIRFRVPSSPPRPCSQCGQPVVSRGKCARHAGQADRQRGTASERGYDTMHQSKFRARVLGDAGYVCVLCGEKATVADHFPRTRKELVAAGCDANFPGYGRALCKRCHDRHTASTSIARPNR